MNNPRQPHAKALSVAPAARPSHQPKRAANGTRLGLVEGHHIDRFYDVECAEKWGEQICRAAGLEHDTEAQLAWIINPAGFWRDLARRANAVADYCAKYDPAYVPLALGDELGCRDLQHPRYEFCGG
jgi:hypothetical protein